MTDTREDRIAELEDELASVRIQLDVAESERDAAIDRVSNLVNELVEVECRRCHVRFRSLPEVQWCTRDCEMGWTSAPSFEQYYAALHKA